MSNGVDIFGGSYLNWEVEVCGFLFIFLLVGVYGHVPRYLFLSQIYVVIFAVLHEELLS